RSLRRLGYEGYCRERRLVLGAGPSLEKHHYQNDDKRDERDIDDNDQPAWATRSCLHQRGVVVAGGGRRVYGLGWIPAAGRRFVVTVNAVIADQLCGTACGEIAPLMQAKRIFMPALQVPGGHGRSMTPQGLPDHW